MIKDFYPLLTCGGRSKKTEVETDQMKEAQKMEEVEQLANHYNCLTFYQFTKIAAVVMFQTDCRPCDENRMD